MHFYPIIPHVKKLLIILSGGALLLGSVASASKDSTPHRSPNGGFVIINTGDTAKADHSFELRRADGTVLYTYKVDERGDGLPSFAENIVWSPNNDFVALKVQTARYIQHTLVIHCATGKVLMVPTQDPDAQTTPIRWTKRGELIVETAGSFGAKPDDDIAWDQYQYRRTFRLRDSASRLDCVFKGAEVFPNRAGLRKQGYKPN